MTELAGQTGIRVALDFAYPGEFFPAEFYPSPPRAALSRERALAGTTTVTGTVDDAAAVSTRSLSGIAAVALTVDAELNRELAFAGTATVTTLGVDAALSRERDFGGYSTTELALTGDLAVVSPPRPLRVHVVAMPDRRPITLTMPAVQASPLAVPTDRPMVTVTMPPARQLTVVIPDRQPIVLKMARGRGTPPPSWRPSFAVRDAAGSYR